MVANLKVELVDIDVVPVMGVVLLLRKHHFTINSLLPIRNITSESAELGGFYAQFGEGGLGVTISEEFRYRLQ